MHSACPTPVSSHSRSSPVFELLYGQQPWGLLDLMQETWEQMPSPFQGLLQYVLQLQGHLIQARDLVKENRQAIQGTQELMYNKGA